MTFSQCHNTYSSDHFRIQTEAQISAFPEPEVNFDFKGNGKSKDAEVFEDTYMETSLDGFDFPTINNDLLSGLKKQLKVLKYRKKIELNSIGKVKLTTEKLIKTIHELLEMHGAPNDLASSKLSAHQLKGEDGKGNVFFTGYFTPVLKVSRKKTARFKYPLYAKPKIKNGDYPTRAQIDGEGVLKDKDLELAYAENLSDIYFMQVQGSGIVEYPDGSTELFAYSGRNRHPYKSIGKYMIEKGYTTSAKVSLSFIKRYLSENPETAKEILFINKSYIFFERASYQSTPTGAGLVPLTTDYSIAVDSKYIPLGSCLLAAVPIIDKRNRVKRHEFRLLLAQDKGGAIKGPGHVDLYTGVGAEGRSNASALHHYGKLWLLLPKEEGAISKPLALK